MLPLRWPDRASQVGGGRRSKRNISCWEAISRSCDGCYPPGPGRKKLGAGQLVAAVAEIRTVTPPEDDLSPGELLPSGRRFRIVLVLGFLPALGPLTIDMYLPALPAITD